MDYIDKEEFFVRMSQYGKGAVGRIRKILARKTHVTVQEADHALRDAFSRKKQPR